MKAAMPMPPLVTMLPISGQPVWFYASPRDMLGVPSFAYTDTLVVVEVLPENWPFFRNRVREAWPKRSAAENERRGMIGSTQTLPLAHLIGLDTCRRVNRASLTVAAPLQRLIVIVRHRDDRAAALAFDGTVLIEPRERFMEGFLATRASNLKTWNKHYYISSDTTSMVGTLVKSKRNNNGFLTIDATYLVSG